jgi:hypothetical protein
MDLADGEAHYAASMSTPRAIRATDGGFRFVVSVSGTALPSYGEEHLWEIDSTGATTELGTYPAWPESLQPADYALSADGALYEMAFGSDGFDVIVRRTIEGTSDIVYTEANHPFVKVHISSLFTGP